MKLKNKKTGEIATVEGFGSAEGEIQMTYTIDNDETKLYLYCTSSLTTFIEEWGDYEEPKTFWAISWAGEPEEYDAKNTPEELKNMAKLIGNYFETKEEAEKAAEKLKAWKRLKDKGFINEQVFSMNLNWCNPDDDDWKAFKLLFGGEE